MRIEVSKLNDYRKNKILSNSKKLSANRTIRERKKVSDKSIMILLWVALISSFSLVIVFIVFNTNY